MRLILVHEDFDRLYKAVARLRCELWLVVGGVAFNIHWGWIAHRAYRKAVDAMREAQGDPDS